MSLDFKIVAGDSKTLNITASSSGDVTLNDVSAIYWKAFNNDGEDVITKAMGSGITITDEDAGDFSVKLDPVDTADLLQGTYEHEACIIYTSGDVLTVRSNSNLQSGKMFVYSDYIN